MKLEIFAPIPVTERAPASQRPHSPDYSPSLINLLASDNSRPGESIKAKLARKMRSLGKQVLEREPSELGALLRESGSEPVCVTPALNVPQIVVPQSSPFPTVTFLDPFPQTTSS